MHRKSAYILVLAILGLVALGIVMLFSTSAFARDSHGDPLYFVKRQGLWLCIGVGVCIGAGKLDYHFWQRSWWIWICVSVVLLSLCFVPPIGMKINGSHRWLNLQVATFQPSELAKLASIVFLAHWFSRYEDRSKRFLHGFAIPMAVVGMMMALIMAEVDLGTTALMAGTMFVMMFVAGTSMLHVVPLAVAGVGAILFAAMRMEERMGRLLAFMSPQKYPDDFYQQLQGLIALGSGGVDGLGLGNGRQKMSYLPFAHTDFILPMVGEELGLRVTLLVVFGFLVMVLCGTIIALRARDRFGMLLGMGIVIILALQAIVNIGVTTALLPNKGLPLPFISYGGSNLVICLLCIGILINIHHQGFGDRDEGMQARLRVRATPRI